MNLSKYWGWQAELDRNILETHNLVENEELLRKKILALNVELGEVANEWRGFKFWSTKESSPKQKILEEWVDCFHFVLSIGNQLGFNLDKVVMHYNDEPLFVFDRTFEFVTEFKNSESEEDFENLLYSIVELAYSLELKNDEIESAYLSKNKTNHKRQEDGY